MSSTSNWWLSWWSGAWSGRNAAHIPIAYSDTFLGEREQTHAIATIFAHALRNLDAFAAVERDLRSFDGPLLVGWGDADPFFAVQQATRTAEATRRSRVSLYPRRPLPACRASGAGRGRHPRARRRGASGRSSKGG